MGKKSFLDSKWVRMISYIIAITLIFLMILVSFERKRWPDPIGWIIIGVSMGYILSDKIIREENEA